MNGVKKIWKVVSVSLSLLKFKTIPFFLLCLFIYILLISVRRCIQIHKFKICKCYFFDIMQKDANVKNIYDYFNRDHVLQTPTFMKYFSEIGIFSQENKKVFINKLFVFFFSLYSTIPEQLLEFLKENFFASGHAIFES